ncbi:MAG: type II and III secretion system protein [Desulfurivibrionaceae bacterium]|nr:type II and III secretion system protein [Desulfurivibrionaceae bacterium]
MTVFILAILFACAPAKHDGSAERETPAGETEQLRAAAEETPQAVDDFRMTEGSQPTTLPIRFQSPSYTLADSADTVDSFGIDEDFVVKVGADISSTGPVMLREILKKLAALKKMNISWASDVDQYSYIDVDIRANDDFFKAIDNLLRQRDYFHVVEGNTIVVKYKETRKFRLAMPFTKSSYAASVGANVSDTSQSSLNSTDNQFDIWDNIRKNLDQVMNIWEESASTAPPPVAAATTGKEGEAAKPAPESRPQSARGYYTIDKPVGLITVTAPRRIIEKVEDYLTSLKEDLYKQISIEAKILEVSVNNEREVGIDWESLLNSSPFTFNMQFGPSTFNNPLGPSGSRSFTLNAKSFTTLLSAIEKQGKTRVLANPRISVMNGQPALINVGKNVTYIDKVTTTVEEGVVKTDVTTDNRTSGIVLSIVPTIMDNDQIILQLTPVTSQLEEPIAYRDFGDSTVGLPVTNVREMSTLVRIKRGEMLVVGGLIDSTDDGSDANVPMLSKVPLFGKLFSLESKVKLRKELIILLKPEII